jgi:hypothetical protein
MREIKLMIVVEPLYQDIMNNLNEVTLDDLDVSKDNSLKITKEKSYTLQELIDNNNLVEFIIKHYSFDSKDNENGLSLNEAYEYYSKEFKNPLLDKYELNQALQIVLLKENKDTLNLIVPKRCVGEPQFIFPGLKFTFDENIKE